jgi:hypothetical protein
MAAENSTQRLEKRGKLLISLLRRGKREHQRNIIVWGGLRLLSVIAVGALVLLVVSLMAPILPRPIGVLLAALAWVGIAWLVWTCWLRPLRAVPNLAIFSRLVEERRDFRDMLRAALEFSERGTPSGGSVDLAATTVDRAYDEARKLDLTSLFQFPRKRRDAAILLGTASACVLLAFLVPAAPQRLVKGLAFAYPSPASIVYGDLEVANGNLDVLAGDDVVVRVLDHGPLAPEMLLRFNDTGDLWKMRRLEPRGAAAPWVYEFRFESIRDHTSYRFESGKRHTEDFRITVVQRPIVNRFSLKLVPPEYTRREPMLLEEGRGDAIALFGTRIEIEGTGSNALVDGYVVPEEDEAAKRTLEHPQQLQVDGSRFSTAFTLRSDLRYHFEVMDQLGHTNADPVTYQISVIEDSPPYVELREPQGDATIPKSLEVPLVIYASDDFGVSRMTVVYKHERDGEDLGNPERRANMQLHGKTAVDPAGKPLGREPAPELIKTFRWHLKEIGLYPGDYVSFYIEVEDNDDFSGHKTARTPTYRLRLPTLGELYAELQDRDENRMSELEEVLEKGEEVREKFEKLARELKKHPEMDWKKEEEVQRALDKQRELAEKVSEIAEDLQREVEKMEEQQLVSSEIAEKMEEIRKLMEQVEDDALREYMERLQEAMKQISPEEMQRAMEKMELTQEEFLKRLERTKALLEQLKREQELDALVERAAELLERQEDLTDRTLELRGEMEQEQAEAGDQEQEGENREGEQAEPSEESQEESERLGNEQEQLSEEMEQLQKELAELTQQMQEAERPELDDVNESMQQQQPSEPMEEAAEQLQQMQPQDAQQSQQEAERRLRALYEQLMNAQMAMSQNMDAEVAQALQDAARQSLDVSFRQEHLTRKAAPVGDYERTGDLARSQQALRSATGNVVEGLDDLGQKSMQVPEHIAALLGQSILKMGEAIDAYEKGNALAGRIHGQDAYADLNRVVIELNRSSKACQSGGGGMSSRQRMDQMTQRQESLNDATRQFHQRLPNPQQMSPEEREAMARLLGEQRAIQQELQDIERQAREQRDLLGRMDKMLEEMKEVVEDMESDALNDETMRVQERILSRMLQARRSLHKRDYNKQRESRTAEELFSEGGSRLEEDDQLSKLRRDILRALESGTPDEYQELVRLYFRAIAEAEEKEVP